VGHKKKMSEDAETTGESAIPRELSKVISVQLEKDRIITDFAKSKDLAVLALIASYVPARLSPIRTRGAELGLSEEFGVEVALREIKKLMDKRGDELPLYLLINSMGGWVPSSYKIAKAIRDSFKSITAFVPHVAVSGGTLLAITGNRIVMGMMSQLSPLDIQIIHGNKEFSAMTYLRQYAVLEDYFKNKHPDEVAYPWKVGAEEVDRTLLQACTEAQETAVTYTCEILKSVGYKNPRKIAEKLVFYDIPSHDAVLNFERSKKIGLKVVRDSEEPDAWQTVKYWLAKYMLKSADRHFIRYFVPSKVK